jgi:hypothetical protein
MTIPSQVGGIDDDELGRLSTFWRSQALRGHREANGIAHVLEVERRKRLCTGPAAHLPTEPKTQPRRWWQFWRQSNVSGKLP